MKSVFVLVLFVLCGTPARAADVAAEFQGYARTDQAIRARLLKPDAVFDLSQYFGSAELTALVGTYSGTGVTNEFVNGKPNPTNMLLWSVVLNGLASDIEQACRGQGLYNQLNVPFLASLLPLCSWPAPEVKTDAVLQSLWIAVMSYDASSAEYEAWRDFFLQGEYAQSPAKEALPNMLLTILMNPYFLLQE